MTVNHQHLTTNQIRISEVDCGDDCPHYDYWKSERTATTCTLLGDSMHKIMSGTELLTEWKGRLHMCFFAGAADLGVGIKDEESG